MYKTLTLIASTLMFVLTSCAVPNDFEKTVKTQGKIESTYIKRGAYATTVMESASSEAEYGKFEVCYPDTKESKRYPVIVVVNGSGVKASSYMPILHHYASWGFIVVGNEQEHAWKGDGTNAALDFVLKENTRKGSPLYGKVDISNIGLVGHSQGGVGVFNAVTTQPLASKYKACVALSPTSERVAKNLKWSYDPSKVRIPTLMFTGTGDFEVKSVIPHADLKAIYDKIQSTKVMARRTGAQHEHMLYSACGYVTAWFMWQLQGDTNASKAFVGTSPELKGNTLYQDKVFFIK